MLGGVTRAGAAAACTAAGAAGGLRQRAHHDRQQWRGAAAGRVDNARLRHTIKYTYVSLVAAPDSSEPSSCWA